MQNTNAYKLEPSNSSLQSVATNQIHQIGIQPIFTMSDAFKHLSDLCKNSNFDHFLVGQLPEDGCDFTSQDLLLSNLPLFLTEDMIALDLFSDWSVIKHFRNTSAPYVWTQSNGITSGQEPPLMANGETKPGRNSADKILEQHLGIQFAHCLPAATKGKRRAFLILFSCNEEPNSIAPEIFLTFQRLFDQIELLTLQRSRNTSHELNARELECLRWAAAGKTSSEIATIVSLSEHTINHYLNSSCRKMDCVNRTQAVAKAIRLSMIQ